MSVTALVALGVEKAFAAVKDLVGIGEYLSVPPTGDDYDPVTDTVIARPPLSNVRILQTSVDSEELAGTVVVVTDVKFLIPAKDLPGVTPRVGDVVRLKGVAYNVVRPKPVPGNSLVIVYARER